ncbi:transcriptional regulator [Leptospira ryugenii]|uniref:Transcriptional regulator n=1 Tax=Leptospira ryugenii TaxID=1917863 RepID=A0A2P2E0H6_9LEPT|nr:transcriptional regulator [Leptospira ryugenii]
MQLAKKPSSIDLSEIYLAVSEHNRIEIPHKEPYTDCPVSCAMGNILSKVSTKVEEDIIQSLKKTKLSELVQQVPKQS